MRKEFLPYDKVRNDALKLAHQIHKDDFIPDNLSGFYAVSFDPKGKLGWKNSKIIDEDPGYGDAQIIEVLTEQVDGRYLAYLQEMNIPYIFAGKNEMFALSDGSAILSGGNLCVDAVALAMTTTPNRDAIMLKISRNISPRAKKSFAVEKIIFLLKFNENAPLR